MDNQFSRRFFISELFALSFGFPVAAGYVLLLLNISIDNALKILVFCTAIAVLVELVISQPMNFLLSKKARYGVKDLQAGRIKTNAERISLYHNLIRLPLLHGIAIFARITFGALVTVIYMATLGISVQICVISLVLAAYGSYLGGLLAYTYVGNAVSPWAQLLVATGAIGNDPSVRKRWFGLSVTQKIIWYLVVPILVTNLAVLFSVYSSVLDGVQPDVLLAHVGGNILVSVVTLLAFLFFTLRMITKPLASLEKSLILLASGEGNTHERVPTDLSDEFAYVTLLMNRALDNFYDVILKLKASSEPLARSIQELGVSSQEISATSNQQAAGVKEIITTMEDSDQLSKRVAVQATEVAKIAEGTMGVVNTGFGLIKQSLEKMEAIKEANSTSIRGIRDLGDKISNIWDIVNIINSIADQTKIIAFNAELEASSAGDAGRNFQIVATEIRRLADSTVTSTSEIKARINEMQNSSDHLILSSEEGTAKIIAGWELTAKLRTLFEDILSTSEISADSATKIASSIGQQVEAFEQILLTLKQISGGIDNFVTSTASTTKLTKVLMDMSIELQSIVRKYDERNAALEGHGV